MTKFSFDKEWLINKIKNEPNDDITIGVTPIEHCFDCDEPATWVRYTQFAGNHYYCEKHAREQEDFNESDPSYFDWERLENNNGQ